MGWNANEKAFSCYSAIFVVRLYKTPADDDGKRQRIRSVKMNYKAREDPKRQRVRFSSF